MNLNDYLRVPYYPHYPNYTCDIPTGTVKLTPVIDPELPGYVGNTYLTKVIYNNPATIAFWKDGSKTIAKCDSESVYSEDVGLLICVLKKCLGAQNAINLIKYWTKEQSTLGIIKPDIVTLKEVRGRWKNDHGKGSK